MSPSGSLVAALRISSAPGMNVFPDAGEEMEITGGLPITTEIVTDSEKPSFPALSVAVAVIVKVPGEVRLCVVVKGKVDEFPMETPFKKNSTWLIIPSSSVAFALKSRSNPGTKVSPSTGDVILIVGIDPTDEVRLITSEVVVEPVSSVAVADIANVPVEDIV